MRALKTLLHGASPEEHARLVREGQALAALEGHPHLIAVHSAGHAGGRGYLVLDYAPGGDLAQLLKAGPLPTERGRALGVALADALAHVHAHGKLHRDLKPQNVLFGAKLLGKNDAPPSAEAGLVGAWLLQAHDLGHPRAAGFLAQLLNKPEAEPEAEGLCPDADERDAPIVGLQYQSANAGCMSAIEWIGSAMDDEDPRFPIDASALDRMLRRRDAIQDQSQNRVSSERKIRARILALAERAPLRPRPVLKLLRRAKANSGQETRVKHLDSLRSRVRDLTQRSE